MLACFAEKTGMELGAGCDLSVRLYALAAQVYALWVQSEWVTRQAFPQTASGAYLDSHAQLRGLERKQAVAARGIVRFTAGEAAQTPREICSISTPSCLGRIDIICRGRCPHRAVRKAASQHQSLGHLAAQGEV